MTPLTQQSYPQYAHVPPERHDPAFAKCVMDVLLEHKGERVHLKEAVGGDASIIYEVVQKLRRIGWVITAEQGVPGYTLVDILPPDGWIRLAPSKCSPAATKTKAAAGKPPPQPVQLEVETP